MHSYQTFFYLLGQSYLFFVIKLDSCTLVSGRSQFLDRGYMEGHKNEEYFCKYHLLKANLDGLGVCEYH